MIRRIELTNFMSHRHTVIEPATGLTVLVGTNNCGKSAVVSALQILCENERGDYMVRHGESECRILIETDDGHTIEWRRLKGTQSYRINGEKVHRLQGSVPTNLHELLRLPKVRSSDEGHEFDVHFGEQKDPIFLINQPGSRAATFFASSSDASRLVEMQQRHRSYGRQAKNDETRLTKEIEDLSGKVDRLKPALALDRKVEEVEEDRLAILELTEQVKAQWQIQKDIRAKVQTLGTLEAEVAALRPLAMPPKLADTSALERVIKEIQAVSLSKVRESAHADALKPLAAPPKLQNTETLKDLIEALVSCQNNQVALEAVCHAAKPLTLPPTLTDTSTLETIIGQLTSADQAVKQSKRPVQVLGKIIEPPTVVDVKSLEELCRQLKADRNRVESLELTSDLLSKLAEPPVPIDDSALADLITRLGTLQGETTELERQLELASEDLTTAEQALRDWALDNPTCPTCGSELDPDRVVDAAGSNLGGHRHG